MENIAERLLYVTVRLEGRTQSGVSVGTGFLFLHRERLFLVTNKHVVQDVINGTMTFHQASNANGILKPKLANCHYVPFNAATFIGHPNDDIDIAVTNISDIIQTYDNGGSPLYVRYIEDHDIPVKEDFEKFISPVEDIVFIGYPNGIWDTKNFFPIIRKGITATPCYIDFEDTPKFLIDASVFPGSSGSPVFIYYAGSYADKQGGLYAGSKLYFIGIISRVYQRQENGVITIKDIPTANVPVAEINQMIDLGIVFNYKVVTETMDHYLRQFNIPDDE